MRLYRGASGAAGALQLKREREYRARSRPAMLQQSRGAPTPFAGALRRSGPWGRHNQPLTLDLRRRSSYEDSSSSRGCGPGTMCAMAGSVPSSEASRLSRSTRRCPRRSAFSSLRVCRATSLRRFSAVGLALTRSISKVHSGDEPLRTSGQRSNYQRPPRPPPCPRPPPGLLPRPPPPSRSRATLTLSCRPLSSAPSKAPMARCASSADS